jgi:hypothetical protein
VLGIALRFFPIAKALLQFEGMAVDPVYSDDALNSAMIVIEVLVRDEQPMRIPIEAARAFTTAEILSPFSPSRFEDKGSDRINPNLCTVYRWVIICAAKRRLFVHHFGPYRYLYEYLPNDKSEKC